MRCSLKLILPELGKPVSLKVELPLFQPYSGARIQKRVAGVLVRRRISSYVRSANLGSCTSRSRDLIQLTNLIAACGPMPVTGVVVLIAGPSSPPRVLAELASEERSWRKKSYSAIDTGSEQTNFPESLRTTCRNFRV